MALYRESTVPIAPSPSTSLSPGDLQVITPPSNNLGSPAGTPSSLTTLRNQQMAVQRAKLLFQGQHSALISSLAPNEAKLEHSDRKPVKY